MGLYHGFRGILSESHGGAAVQRPQKRLLTGIPCQVIRWICEAGPAEHTHRCGFCHIYALIQVPDLLLSLASSSGLPPLRAPEGKTPCYPKGGRWMGNNEKSFRILQHWCYREKEDKRADKDGQGRRQLPPASPIRFPHSCLCFPPGYRGFFDRRQRALRGQREKRGVSEESEHSCEKCHSYLGN